LSFTTLLRREPRALSFGLLHTIAATIGQTFVISLFLPGIKASFALSDAHVAVLFSAATLASAVAVWKIGALMDRADVVRYCVSCGLFLALSCIVMATAPTFIMLAAGMFCLRLAGNGLLSHVALTATARYFTRDRGQALSLVLLGSSIGEAALPAVLVASIGTVGWRWTLAAAGCFGLMLVVAAAAAIRKEAAFRSPNPRASEPAAAPRPRSRPRPHTDQRRYFALTAGLFFGMPMVITATIFHQAVAAEAKGVSLQWFALSFIAFPVSRVLGSVATGRFVDRIGSDWLFCLHLLPLIAGTAALILVSSPWVVPLYWFCAGVTSGVGTVVQNTVVAERVTLSRLGTARSILAAATIVASALGPPLFGLALAAGASMPTILWASVAVLIVATVLGLVATRMEARQRGDRI
jgi:predicted MFS family arabinose efflux permease